MTKEEINEQIIACGNGHCKRCGHYNSGSCNWHNKLKELEDDM